VFEDGAYAFNHALPYWFDVAAFEATLDQARRSLRAESSADAATRAARAIPLLEAAAGLYQGDFLEGLAERDWILPRREALRGKYLEARLTLGRLFFDQRDYGKAAESYRQVLAHDPYEEAAHRGLMACLARKGETAQALQQYQKLVEVLRQDIGSPPAEETVALAERLRRGEAV
jgi:DNA-binding SARP family transcriptional activator